MNPLPETITETTSNEHRRVQYLALESRYEGSFLCEALGRALYSESQLREWATRASVELVLLKRETNNY